MVSTTLVRTKQALLTQVALVLSAITGVMLVISHVHQSIGFLVSQFGLSWQDASIIISILLTEGGAGIAVFAPYLIPFVATLDGLIAFVGVSAAIGW